MYWTAYHPILEKGDSEVCMLERLVSVELKEEEVGFGGVPSLSHFVEAFDALFQ